MEQINTPSLYPLGITHSEFQHLFGTNKDALTLLKQYLRIPLPGYGGGGAAQQVVLNDRQCEPSVLLTLMDHTHRQHFNDIVHGISISDAAKTLHWLESSAHSTVAELCGWKNELNVQGPRTTATATTNPAEQDPDVLVTALIALIRYLLGLQEGQIPPPSMLDDNRLGGLRARITKLLHYNPLPYPHHHPQSDDGFTKVVRGSGRDSVGTMRDRNAYINLIENWKIATARRKKQLWFAEAEREKWMVSPEVVKKQATALAEMQAELEEMREMREWYKSMKLQQTPTTANVSGPTVPAQPVPQSAPLVARPGASHPPATAATSQAAPKRAWNKL